MHICEAEKCTGCFACVNVCPKNCISMAEGKLGHIYPQIDESLCINCGACSRVCPQNSAPEFRSPMVAYAAYSANAHEHKSSTSGGLAALFSRKIIEKGGVVYGCSSDIERGIKHIRATNIEELGLLRGSKYVQSNINDTYRQAKADLEDDKTVLFIATPCQIGGFKNYLKKDYDKLITVDLLCHGVPSQTVLFEHLKSTGVKAEAFISFREPAGQFLKIADREAKTLYRKSSFDDLYYLCFLSNLTLRDSCHNCSFAKAERCSDITIGDFWGLGSDSTVKSVNGVSAVLTVTEKGELFFSSLKDSLILEKREISEVVAGNHPLRLPASPAPGRYKFISLYEKHGFKKAAKKILFKQRFVAKTKTAIKKVLNIIRKK